MDILLINASVYELPVSQRAGAIVYDGTADLGLWRPPGPDRELLHVYGDSLSEVLAKERAQGAGKRLEQGEALRLHPGKLRCDYLIWVASRSSHGETEAAPAPGASRLEQVAEHALTLAAKHGTLRVAFGAAGAGPDALPIADRLAAVVRGANAYRKACLDSGRATVIEEVLVCCSSAAEIAKAKRLTAQLARQRIAEDPIAARRQERAPSTASRTARAPRAPRTARTARSSARLDPQEVARARTQAKAYDRAKIYCEGDWFIHPRFGAGRVRAVLGPERMVTVLFEDGEERKLIHARD